MGDINDISPEVASQIITKFVLPMFESKGKKELNAKYNKLQGIA